MTFWGLYLFDVLLDVEFVGLFVVGAGVLDVHTRPHQLPVALAHGGVGGSDGLVSFHCQNRLGSSQGCSPSIWGRTLFLSRGRSPCMSMPAAAASVGNQSVKWIRLVTS